ncbi:4a-hydroxytetrahydrobiopterin dehydratase [bacterium]|nr:MAG: 4a-hydroxytetrahydrobiopterin dehydratase [bacterium]
MDKPDFQYELTQLTAWQADNNALIRTFVFDDFKQAMGFIVQVGIVAETLNHHPEIYNVYNKVTFRLSTHDAGNTVTIKDIELAKQIDHLV